MGFLNMLLEKGRLKKPLHFALEKIVEEYVPAGEMPPYAQELISLADKDNLKLKDIAELAVSVRIEIDYLKADVESFVVTSEKAKRVQSNLALWNEILSELTRQYPYQDEVTDTETFIQSKAVEEIPRMHHAISQLLEEKNRLQLESQLVLQLGILQKSIFNLEQTFLTMMPEIRNIKDKKLKLEEDIGHFQRNVEELKKMDEAADFKLSAQLSEKGKALLTRKKTLSASEKEVNTYMEAVQKTAIQIFGVFKEVSLLAADRVRSAIYRLSAENKKTLRTADDTKGFSEGRKKLSQLYILLELLNDCIRIHQKYDRQNS
ncbi:hypothetical protein [Lacrimispora sp. 38-1]|uniref:hypothetical protein n=1 Tax=Lacrimispora sp. 38-1 TaxID=3125778 RepID=UPI003CF375D3